MPIYTYKLANGETREEFQRMADEPLTVIDGQPCERVPHLAAVRTQFGEGNSAEPIEMLSIALDNEYDIDEFRRRNPGVEVSRNRRDPRFGVPIALSRNEKKRILKTEGFVEQNGY